MTPLRQCVPTPPLSDKDIAWLVYAALTRQAAPQRVVETLLRRGGTQAYGSSTAPRSRC